MLFFYAIYRCAILSWSYSRKEKFSQLILRWPVSANFRTFNFLLVYSTFSQTTRATTAARRQETSSRRREGAEFTWYSTWPLVSRSPLALVPAEGRKLS